MTGVRIFPETKKETITLFKKLSFNTTRQRIELDRLTFEMNKVLTAVALFTLAPGLFAAPLVPGQPDASEDPSDGGKAGNTFDLLTD